MEEKQFVNACKEVLKIVGYEIVEYSHESKVHYDFFVKKDNLLSAVEVKYYRQIRPNRSYLQQAVMRTMFDKPKNVSAAIIMTSGIFGKFRKVYEEIPILIFDGLDILNYSKNQPALYEKILQLLPEGIDNIEEKPTDLPKQIEDAVKRIELEKIKQDKQKYSDDLISDLKSIKSGSKHARTYELHLKKIFEFLFNYDLIGWWDQRSSDDGLNRYDVICRVRSNHEFWRMIREDFGSRYVIFEFKNYTKPITPHEIYTTERYLYSTAKRSFSIIASRKGPNKRAQLAAVGALREYGKCIICLSDIEIIKMIEMMNNGDDPHNLLFDKLDDIMTKIAR